MEIIKFYKRKEYIIGLILIILYIHILISFYIFIPKISYIILYLVNIFILIVYFSFCIFLESIFNGNYLKLLQIRLEKKMFFISLIAQASVVLNHFSGINFVKYYLVYMNNCPFNYSELDYKLHLKRRCELYNINSEKNIYQYICSFNAEIDLINLDEKQYVSISNTDIKCSLVKSLINNNEVIDSFVDEYNNENIYYCDLKKQPVKYPYSINHKFCQPTFFFPKIFVCLSWIFVIYFCKLNFTYFRNIKANSF